MRTENKQKSMINLKRQDKKQFDDGNDMQMKEINKPEDESKDIDSQAEEDIVKKQPLTDYKDSYEMSKIALERCKQIAPSQHDFLRRGAGHFVSNPQSTIIDAYRKVFDIQ